MGYVLEDGTYRFSSAAFNALFRDGTKGPQAIMQAMSTELHVGISSIMEWRRGAHAPSDIEKVKDIAGFFGIEPEALLIKEAAMPEHESESKLNDLQVMALYRVNAAIVDFYQLMNLIDKLVWGEYDLEQFPPSLVVDVLPSWRFPESGQATNRNVETGVRADDLAVQAARRFGMRWKRSACCWKARLCMPSCAKWLIRT